MITARQNEVFRFIAAEIFSTGVPPSHQEIADKLGFASKGGVAECVRLLCDKGLLTKLPKQARAITLTEAGEKLARVGRPMLATESERAYMAELLQKHPVPWSPRLDDERGGSGLFDSRGGYIAHGETDLIISLAASINVLSRIRP